MACDRNKIDGETDVLGNLNTQVISAAGNFHFLLLSLFRFSLFRFSAFSLSAFPLFLF